MSYITDGVTSTGGDAVHAAWDNDLDEYRPLGMESNCQGKQMGNRWSI